MGPRASCLPPVFWCLLLSVRRISGGRTERDAYFAMHRLTKVRLLHAVRVLQRQRCGADAATVPSSAPSSSHHLVAPAPATASAEGLASFTSSECPPEPGWIRARSR